MKTEIIAIANQKGGVGKTTTCANLGVGLAQTGKKVLLIDGDPQGSLTISLGHPQPDKLPFTLSDAMGRILMDEPIKPGEGILHHPEGVDLMPADIQLSGMEVSLVNAMSRETILRQYLDTVKGQYSHILIDCHGEMAQYQASYQANFACKEAVEQAINAHYGDKRLDTGSAVKEVVEKFGPERVEFILANTIRHKDGDGRISRDNKAWAKTVPVPEDSDSSRHCAYLVVDSVNPGLTDLFAREVRNSVQKAEKRSVLDQLKQEPPARKPAAPKKREPER